VRRSLLAVAIAVLTGCRPSVVDTRTAKSDLLTSMGNEDMAVAIAATKRLSELYRDDGLAEAVRSDQVLARRLAANELRSYRTDVAKVALLDALKDDDAWVRATAADSMGHNCDASCAPDLERVASSDVDDFPKRMAAQALDRIRR